jgi:ribosomal protein S24E
MSANKAKMKIEIASEAKNSFLGRKEITFQTIGKPTPSREALKAELSKLIKANEQLIVIDLVDQKTGSNLVIGKAKVYDNEEVMKKVELDYRNKRGVKEKKEEAPAEAAKAE